MVVSEHVAAAAEEIPREVREFFAENALRYTDVAGNLALAHQAGFAPLDHFNAT